jgi:hypothetical protein
VTEEFFEVRRPSSLLKPVAAVDEVAALVTQVVGELSSATNGGSTSRRQRRSQSNSMTVASGTNSMLVLPPVTITLTGPQPNLVLV